MLSAYRTVSADAACVLAGIEPVELKIEMLVRVAADVENGMEKRESEARRKDEMLREWQQSWEGSGKGRVTFDYIREVRRGEVWKINHNVTQVLTGHGNF